MDAILNAINSALGFVYDNILSIAMMLLLIAVGVFLTVKQDSSNSGNLAT